MAFFSNEVRQAIDANLARIQAYNETLWLNDLRTLAGLESSLGVSNIIGIDIYNAADRRPYGNSLEFAEPRIWGF